MPRVFRRRDRIETYRGSYADYMGDTDVIRLDYPRVIDITSSIGDYHGRPIADSGLDSVQRRGYVFVNGSIRGSHGLARFKSYPVLPQNGYSAVPLIAPPLGWVLTLVAGTNPSRPVVTPPELLQNLYELPRMLRNLASFLANPKTVLTPKGAANEYLGIKFGWLPMIKDIMDVLDMQDHIDKRLKEVKQLHSGKGLRRRRKFGDNSAVFSTSAAISHYGTAGSLLRGSVTVKNEAWATIRWKPTESLPYHPDDSRYRNHIRNVVLGLTPEGMAKGLWNVIPWTWLAGWFTNIGSLVLSRSNSIGASWGHACFMSQQTVTIVGSDLVVTGSGGKYIDAKPSGTYTHITKSRVTGTAATPGFFMPMLDMSRLSVLGALVLQRFR